MIRNLATALTLALLVWAGSAAAQETYADPQGRFVTPVPEGWSLETTPDVATLRRTEPEGVLHVLAPIGGEEDVVAAALAILVDPALDADFFSAPLQASGVPLPSGMWTQRIYQVGDDIVAAISQERGGYTVLVLAQATQSAFVGAVNAAVNQVLLGLEVLIAAPEATAPEALPYRVEEVTFASGDVTLAGLLTLPEGDGPFPAVAMVSGSGAQDRDGSNAALPGYAPLRWLADHLARTGFAVLRWDERGVGASTGDQNVGTSQDLADDLEAGFEYLRDHPAVDPDRVGILGHSEGGALVAMVAARNPEVAFVIAMAPPGVPYTEGVITQVQRISEASGMSPEAVAEAVGQQRRVIELVLAEDWAGLESFLVGITTAQLEGLTDAQRAEIGDVDAFVAQQAAASVAVFQIPWMRFYLHYDPAEDWAQVTAPVLVLLAGRDVQVDLEENRPPLEAALEAAGNDDATVVVFPEANHLFQQSTTGNVDEYLRLEMALLPGFLEEISAWLTERFLP